MNARENHLPPHGGRTVNRADLIVAALLAATGIGVMFDAWRDIFRSGTRQEELSYVFLAPAVIAWIAIAWRERLFRCRVRGQWVGLLIIVIGWLVYFYGYLADPVLWRGGAVMVAVGAVISALGAQVLLRLWPVFVATIFLVPISPYGRYHIAVPLQNITAELTQTMCDLTGIYVTRSGNLISINGVGVTIAEACNGMRMVITLIMVCYVVAFTSPLPGYIRALLVALSPGVAIIANVVRLVPTVWMFGHKSIQTAEAFHAAAGWIMTVCAFLFLMGCARLVNWALTSERPQPISRLVRVAA
jgi:exosortase